MDCDEFILRAHRTLAKLPYISKIEFVKTGKQASGKALVACDMRLNLKYHQVSMKLNFALISKEGRIWAIDNHKPNGWHRHPLHDLATHQPIDPMEKEAIVAELEEVIQNIQE